MNVKEHSLLQLVDEFIYFTDLKKDFQYNIWWFKEPRSIIKMVETGGRFKNLRPS